MPRRTAALDTQASGLGGTLGLGIVGPNECRRDEASIFEEFEGWEGRSMTMDTSLGARDQADLCSRCGTQIWAGGKALERQTWEVWRRKAGEEESREPGDWLVVEVVARSRGGL